MNFNATTAPPEGQTAKEKKQDEIKGLLFKAVMLYVEDNEDAKKELLGLLGTPETLGTDVQVSGIPEISGTDASEDPTVPTGLFDPGLPGESDSAA